LHDLSGVLAQEAASLDFLSDGRQPAGRHHARRIL
jgi:hypothetical protein